MQKSGTSGGSRGLQEFAYAPDVIGDPRCHRRSRAEGLMDAPEVIPAVPEHHGSAMVLPLFAEAIREPGESAKAHPERKVASLYYRSANAIRVRLTHNWDHLHGLDFGGTVPAFTLTRGAVDLDELGEVAAVVQRVADRRFVARESIARNLKSSARSCVANALNEYVCCLLVTLADGDVEYQLGVPLYSYEHVAVSKKLVIFGPDALLFFTDEAPYFVALNVAHFDVAELVSHDALGLLACEHQEFQNRALIQSSEPNGARNACAFQQHGERLLRFLDRQVHAIKGVIAGVREHFAALGALVPLAITAFPKLAALCTAVVAGHSSLELSSSRVYLGIGPKIHSLGFGLRLNPVGSFNYLPGFVFVTQPQWGRPKSLSTFSFRYRFLQEGISNRVPHRGAAVNLFPVGIGSLLYFSRFVQPLQYHVNCRLRIGIFAQIATKLMESFPNLVGAMPSRITGTKNRADFVNEGGIFQQVGRFLARFNFDLFTLAKLGNRPEKLTQHHYPRPKLILGRDQISQFLFGCLVSPFIVY